MSAHEHRPDWMGLLARAPEPELCALWRAAGAEPAFDWVRPPETGTVTLQGRADATGVPFTLGEMTVTRCALRLGDDTGGIAHVPGRAPEKARIAALCDALLQTESAGAIRRAVLEPLAAAEAARHRHRAARALSTRLPAQGGA